MIFVCVFVASRNAAAQDKQLASEKSFAQFLMLVDEEVSEELEAQSGEEILAEENSVDPLSLADVVASLYRSYPDIARARQQPGIASGQLLAAYGAFDTKLQAHSLSEPTGFYRNYRNGLGVARQTWWGGYVAAGYRIGRGFYQPWYKERQTDDAGEFKVAFTQPLLQGRAIDPQRVAVFQASLAQQAAGPIIQQTILDISRDAAAVYWEWVAMGGVLEAQREMLKLAEERGEQFEVGVKAGKFAEIDLILNQQLVAERQAKVFETEQKFRATSFKLALFLRDPNGQPMVPEDTWLPERFPVIEPPPLSDFQSDLAAALSRRPEPKLLQLDIRHVQYDRQLACNEMLPRFDFVTEASQDMGDPATKSDDKGDFELVIGFTSEVPVQRRKARGKIQETNGKIVQINEKLRMVRDKIGIELQTAYNALLLSEQVVEQTEVSLRAALETLDRYRFAFEQGKIDLIYLNLLETKANETEIKLVEAQRNWFAALSQMQITLGLDPLDQAMAVSSLPDSDMPGPGNLPQTSRWKPAPPKPAVPKPE
ncbi:TolC family protein [Rubripirellula reticaptiva]|nr:TolC family protein [Rubripirellula reticaptiva]